MYNYKIVFSYLYLFLILSCNDKYSHNYNNSILIQINDNVILKNEFIKRAEFVIRPDYCNKSNNIHKNIVLNSLIAEKILAIEGRDIFNYNLISNYITGLRNQSMREKLFYIKSEVDSINYSFLEIYYKSAMRTYDITFINYKNNMYIDTLLNDNTSYEVLNDILNSQENSEREVSFFLENNFILHKAIFSKLYKKGDIIGPINLNDGYSIIMKIKGWKTKKRISEIAQNDFVEDIKDHMKQLKKYEIYSNYIHRIMKNKKLKFNKEPFFKFATNLYNEMVYKENNKKALFKKAIWLESKLVLNGDFNSIDISGDDVIFNLDGEDWSMSKLENLIKIHPIVFRKKKIAKDEFSNAVKLAISDLIRDYFLVNEAKKYKLDKDPYIIQYVKMWEDYFIAQNMRTQILKNKNLDIDDVKYLNPIIKDLFVKYSNSIKIDFNLLESIELTSIPMHVINNNSAYQSPIPSFPKLTDSYKLDYFR